MVAKRLSMKIILLHMWKLPAYGYINRVIVLVGGEQLALLLDGDPVDRFTTILYNTASSFLAFLCVELS